MSKVFEPNTFEVASVILPFFAFTTEITVSGTDVAAAVIVNAIIIGETLRILASSIDCSVRKKVAIPIMKTAIMKIERSFNREMFGDSGFSS